MAPRIARVWSFGFRALRFAPSVAPERNRSRSPTGCSGPNGYPRDCLLAFAHPADREKLKLHRISVIHLLLDSGPVGIDGCDS